ncbi:hypothetical protein [Achromobacter sp. ACRQX]|uniref:hypothetical protein n=1 Tax=Achromobacter sp. ACRQX TaxID=2918181 RepID=UPI001EF2C85D|nr:hypothetical protein [Achromobacter sp. ACRQX]MCG7328032.1 hypothetical protein [Achromobacter sp. ACRQX]
MNRLAFIAILIGLGGCAAVQNISATDIRNQAHLRAEKDFPLTIAQISQALYEHQSKCSDAGKVVQNPGNPNEGFITVEMPGLSKGSVALLIDLRQEGNSTHAKGYTYYSTWKGHVATIFKAIEDPADCG